MNIERFHNQLALHLGYKRILDRNIDIHVDDSKDETWVTVEVKQPEMTIRLNPSLDVDVWSGQISPKQKKILISYGIDNLIKEIIDKVFCAYRNAVIAKF